MFINIDSFFKILDFSKYLNVRILIEKDLPVFIVGDSLKKVARTGITEITGTKIPNIENSKNSGDDKNNKEVNNISDIKNDYIGPCHISCEGCKGCDNVKGRRSCQGGIFTNLKNLICEADLASIYSEIDELCITGFGFLNKRFHLKNGVCPDAKNSQDEYLICCEMKCEAKIKPSHDEACQNENTYFLSGYITAAPPPAVSKKPAQSPARINDNLSLGASLVQIVGKKGLLDIQLPLGQNRFLYTAILDEKGDFICSSSQNNSENEEGRYSLVKKRYIKIDNRIYGSWLIASNDEAVIDRYSLAHQTLCETLSKLASSYVMLYNEMKNTERANKMLGKTIEQQILLSNIDRLILGNEISDKTICLILEMVGDFLDLDSITIYKDINDLENKNKAKCRPIYNWSPIDKATMPEGLAAENGELLYCDFRELVRSLDYCGVYYSDDDALSALSEYDGCDFSSYMVANLNGDRLDENKYGVIVFGINHPSRTLTYSEKRLLRSVSQIISSVIIRCRDRFLKEEEASDSNNENEYSELYVTA